MKVNRIALTGVLLIQNVVHSDLRGCFIKTYSEVDFSSSKINIDIREIFYSLSKKNVIRGMHFQLPPFEQAKLVSVVKGRINDVLLDLRIDSETFGKHTDIELRENDGNVLYIPPGVAHGFVSREEESVVLYAVDFRYTSDKESGIRYDSFGYDWKVDNPILSIRDLHFKRFDQFESSFRMR